MTDPKATALAIQRYARCTSKRPYPTELQARKAARFQRREHGKRFNPHHCPDCGYWHLVERQDT